VQKNRDSAEAEEGMKTMSKEFIESGKEIYS
jgi:hypothetical protein